MRVSLTFAIMEGKRLRIIDVVNVLCGPNVASRSNWRWPLYWCGCRSKSHCVWCEPMEMRKHVGLPLAMGRDGEMQSA